MYLSLSRPGGLRRAAARAPRVAREQPEALGDARAPKRRVKRSVGRAESTVTRASIHHIGCNARAAYSFIQTLGMRQTFCDLDWVQVHVVDSQD